MRRYSVVVISAVVFLLSCAPGIVMSQGEEEIGYSWGTVSSISSGQIVVSEYDYDKQEEADVAYIIDSNTELINVDSPEDIKVGDSVDIEYAVKDNQKVAEAITVSSYQEGDEPQETSQEQLDCSSEEIAF